MPKVGLLIFPFWSINQVYYFNSTLQARFHNNRRKNTSAMLNVNTTKITIVDETIESA